MKKKAVFVAEVITLSGSDKYLMMAALGEDGGCAVATFLSFSRKVRNAELPASHSVHSWPLKKDFHSAQYPLKKAFT